MKLISFAVPSYNSEAYLNRCVDSLLPGGEDVEIIIVNDGSKDGTLRIAREYEAKYPTIVRVVDKENGGHGSGVNAGLDCATGLFYKVVDSDDWVDKDALLTILDKIRAFVAAGTVPDTIFCNYVYEHLATEKQYPVRYKKVFPEGRIFTWDDTGRFGISQYIMMHTAIQRREMLLESGIRLPEHTFYVDTLLVYVPLPYTKTMYYVNVDFYRYYIGRADQSVNEDALVRRVDQQVRVAKLLIDAFPLEDLERMNKKMARYMVHDLSVIMSSVTAVLILAAKKDKSALKTKKELWQYMKDNNPLMYKRMRFGLGRISNRKTWLGRKISIFFYHMSKRIYKFA